MALLFLLMMVLLWALNQPSTQHWLTPKLEGWLAEKLQTKLKLEGVGVRFPKALELNGVEIWTPTGDSLMNIGSLVVEMDLWALLDNQVVLQNIRLENADLRLQQSGGTTNFDFILAAFASPQSPESATRTTDEKAELKINISNAGLNLKNVKFDWQDLDNQQFINASIGKMAVHITAGDVENTKYLVKRLSLADATIGYRDLGQALPDTSSQPSFFDILVKNADVKNSRVFYENSELKLNAALDNFELEAFGINSDETGLSLSADGLELEKSSLSMSQKLAKATPGRFNAADFEFLELDGRFTEFSFQNESLELGIQRLSGKEKSGLDIQRLSGNINYNPTELTLQNLDLQANSTVLKGDAKLNFDKTGQAPIAHFEAKLGRSEGTLADLLRLLPPSPSLKDFEGMGATKWALNGSLSGNLESLQAQGLQLKFGKNTHLFCTGYLTQLSNLNQLGGMLKITDLQFDKDDFTPFLIDKNWILPAYAKLSGNVGGKAGALNLNLSGSLGNLDSLAFAPVLSDTALFDLSGTVANIASPKLLQLDLEIRRLEAPGRQFANFVPSTITLPDQLAVKGKLKGSLTKMYTDLRLAAVRDGATSTLDLDGFLSKVDSPDSLSFDMNYTGSIAKQELTGYLPDSLLRQYLDLPQKINLHGKVKGRPTDLHATTLLDISDRGSLAIDAIIKGEDYKAKIHGKDLKINEIAADSLLPKLKNINLTATLEGTGFEFGKTANAVLDGQIQSLTWEDKTFENLTLNGRLNAEKIDFALQSPDPKLHMDLTAKLDFGASNERLEWTANFNCIDLQSLGISEKRASACFLMKGAVAGFSLDTLDAQVLFSQLHLQFDTAKANPTDLMFSAKFQNDVNEIQLSSTWLNGKLAGHFDLTNLPAFADAFAQQYFKTKATPDTELAGLDELDFSLKFDQPDIFKMGIVPGLSELGKFDIEGQFQAATRRFRFSTNLPLASYDDYMVSNLNLEAVGDGKTAKFELKIPTVLQDGESLVKDLRLTGNLDGHRAEASLLALDSLGQERFKLGLFAESTDFEDGYALHFTPKQTFNYTDWTIPENNSLRFDGDFVSIKNLHLENGEQSLKIDGATKLKAGSSPSLDFSLGIKHLNLSNFEPLMVGVLSKVEGWLDADIELGGTTAAPKPSGSFALNGAKTTIETTKVRYAINDASFNLTSKGIEFDELRLTDPKLKQLKINGLIKTSNWLDYQYDLTLASKEWQLLNNTQKDGSEYFGKLWAKLDGTVKGPLAQPDITLSASPVTGSELNYIYDAAVGQSEGNGLVVFKKSNTGAEKRSKESSKKYPLHLNLNLDITDALQLKVVTDPASGDNFVGNLDGRLSLEIFPDGKMNLAGRTFVKKGIYRFTYQQLVRRIFKLTPESNLTWTGDPFNPEMEITARFVVRTSPYPLLEAQPDNELPGLKDFQTFFLNFNMTGDANSPILDINLSYPENEDLVDENTTNSEDEAIKSTISSAVNLVNNDEAKLSYQVFGLLISQQFLGGDNEGQSSLGKGLNSLLTSSFNNLADRYLKFVDINLEVSEDAVLGEDNQYVNSTNYNLQLQKTFLNERLVFKVSGVATGSENEVRSSLNNALVEYSIKPNGSLKIRGFTEEGIEIFDSEATRNSGAGIVFTKEFKRLFKRKK